MTALITEAQWRDDIGTATVTDLTGDDADVITSVIAQASDYVAEFAVGAGVTLTAASLTDAMRRRVSVVAAYYAADARQEYRDAQGQNPYRSRYAEVTAELSAWHARQRQISTATPATAPRAAGPLTTSDRVRGW